MSSKILSFCLSALAICLLLLSGCASDSPVSSEASPVSGGVSGAPSSSEAASAVPESSMAEYEDELPPLTSEAELANDTEVSMELYPGHCHYTEVPEEIANAALADAEKALGICLDDGSAKSGFFKDVTIFQISKDGNKFCYSARLVFEAVDPEDISWYAGNTRFYEGEMEGYVSLYRQFRLEKQDGEWVRTGFGTGGVGFEE